MRVEELFHDDVESGCHLHHRQQQIPSSLTFQDEYYYDQQSNEEKDNNDEIFFDATQYSSFNQQQQQQQQQHHDHPLHNHRTQQHSRHNLPLLFDSSKINFRSILPKDRRQIQLLHEEWFPVSYQQEFYDELVYGKMCHTGENLYTNLATTTISTTTTKYYPTSCRHHSPPPPPPTTTTTNLIPPTNNRIRRRRSNSTSSLSSSIIIDLTTEEKENNADYFCSSTIMKYDDGAGSMDMDIDINIESTTADIALLPSDSHEDDDDDDDESDEEEIIACLVGSIVQDTRLNRMSRNLLLPNPSRHNKLFYIMTLGTKSKYRSLGLATQLIQQCITNIVSSDTQCGGLYLHVITTNISAIKFYERLGFWRVQEIPDYYTIDGKHYNCYLYAIYFNGNRGHLGMFQIVSWWISSIWKRVKDPLSHFRKSLVY